MFLTMDIPSVEVRLLDEKFKLTKSIGTTLDISNRDAVITYMAWSETEQRLACILGNYSISIWSL